MWPARLEAWVEELTDIALDALRRGHLGPIRTRPRPAKPSPVERRIVRPRRAVEEGDLGVGPGRESLLDDEAR